MSVDPADMLLFVAVVREGGFSAAARALGTTKQRVSQRIAHLEAVLGVRLLERTTRHVRPTEAGLAYHRHCAAIDAQIHEANESVRASGQAVVGHLRVSAPTLLGRRLLGPVLTRYLAAHPDVTVDLALADRRVDLLQEGFDLAIRVGDLADSSLAARRLGDAEAAFVGSPSLLRHRAPPTPDDVASWPWVSLRVGERWEIGGRRVRIDARLVANDQELLRDACVAGLGLARLPLMVCEDDVDAGRLVRVLGDAGVQTVPIHALLPSRTFLPLRVRRFLDLVVEHLGPRPSADPAVAR